MLYIAIDIKHQIQETNELLAKLIDLQIHHCKKNRSINCYK